MRRLILTTASVLALGIGGAGFANAQGYSNQGGGSANMPSAQTNMPSAQESTPSAQAPRTQMQTTSKRPSAARISKTEVKQAQQKLREEGLYRGRIDGVLGPRTKTALRTFQRKNGLPATASLDRRTMSALSGGGMSSGRGDTTSGQGSSMSGSSGNAGAVPMTPPAGKQEQPGTAGNGTGAGPSTGTQPKPQK